MVVKMRGGAHSPAIREYTITPAGLVFGAGLPGYRGLVTGTPRWIPAPPTPRRRARSHD